MASRINVLAAQSAKKLMNNNNPVEQSEMPSRL